MKAIVVTDQAAGTAGMKLVERPGPKGGSLGGYMVAHRNRTMTQYHFCQSDREGDAR